MTFRVEGIDHVELFVRDIPAAIRWYGEVLGLVEVCRWNPEPIMIGAGGTTLALFQSTGDTAKRTDGTPGWHRVAWRTDRAGFEAAQRHLAGRGINFRGPIDHGVALSIYFQDPEANLLEVTCPQ